MPNCVAVINNILSNNQYEEITELQSDISFPLVVNSSTNQLFRVEIIKQETVLFNISLSAVTPPSNIGVTCQFYQYVNNSIISLGSVLITEMNLNFQKDFNIGSYIICIRSNFFSYTGFFTGYFSHFPIWAKLYPRAYAGETLNSVDLEIVKYTMLQCSMAEGSCASLGEILSECNKLLYFVITDGKLPENLNMDMIGRISGILPNMDCTEDNALLSPSQNWYHNFDNYWVPWGREYRFKIYLWMAEYPEINTDRWFCIKVFNNWSWDRDNFVEQPIEYVKDYLIESPEITLPELCCEQEEPFITLNDDSRLKPLNIELCPCEEESENIKFANLNFLQWYQTVLLNPPEENPYIQKFIERFRQTDYFKELVEQYSIEEILYTPIEIELNAVKKRIEFYNSQLDENGRRPQDVDAIMLEMKNKVNLVLPTTAEIFVGEYLSEFNLETLPHD